MSLLQMHLSLQPLSDELLPLVTSAKRAFIQADHDKLMNLMKRIKGLGDNDGVVLDSGDESARRFLYSVASQVANRQEDFYKNNGNKWAS